VAVAVEIGDDGVGHGGFDDVVIFAEGRGARVGRGDGGPVVWPGSPAAAVAVEDKGHFVEAGVGAGSAVVDVARDDDFAAAVAVEVDDGSGGGGEVGAMFDAAVGVATQINGVIDVHAGFAPPFVTVHGVGLDLGAAAFVGVDVMHVGGHDDLGRAV